MINPRVKKLLTGLVAAGVAGVVCAIAIEVWVRSTCASAAGSPSMRRT